MKKANDAKPEQTDLPESGKKRKTSSSIRAFTAIVIVAVLLVNLAVSLLGDKKLWYIDLTREKYKSAESAFYTLSESCRTLVADEVVPSVEKVNGERAGQGLDKIKVNIIFCAEKDIIEQDGMMKYVSYTARALQKYFPDEIKVSYINITKNPSAVQKYKTTSAATIYTSDVIVEFGSEYLVQRISSFYYTEASESQPWAYNGEKRLVAMIQSVTQAESPICCLTSNHGESLFDSNGNIKEKYTTFIKVIEGAGYDVVTLDLERDDIPDNCRMIITFDPMYDFKAFGNLGENNVSEIEKLDKYLDAANSFFYICDRDTPENKNLDEYLEEWGVTVSRVENAANMSDSYFVKDGVSCIDPEGNAIVGKYATEGLGATLTEDMRRAAYPAMVVFVDSTAITPSPSYYKSYVPASEENGTAAFSYYRYFKNGVGRNMLDVFTTYPTAYAEVAGEQYEIATDKNQFKLMTVTQEQRNVQEDNFTTVNQASYVICLSSTEFLTNEMLDSTAYGNTDVILSALRNTGSEVVPTDIDLKAFYEYSVESNAAYVQVNVGAWSICLWAIPAAIALIFGTVVCVRRKYK